MELTKKLIIEIVNFINTNANTCQEKNILNILKKFSLTKNNYTYPNYNSPPKIKSLQKALSNIQLKKLFPVKKAILSALPELNWKIDNGSFYDKHSEVGLSYLNGNMNTELIGPERGSFKSHELRLGLFLLEPNIFYRDHKHEAPELYINLTNNILWRFNNSKWKKKDAGNIIFNEPFQVHAMKINNDPFLSIWCWPYNSSKKCILVPKKDWGKIEI
tara:strand:- start:414 stop:1064 length:651 start_codon:yes stop_codon:yes gene_type:complete